MVELKCVSEVIRTRSLVVQTVRGYRLAGQLDCGFTQAESKETQRLALFAWLYLCERSLGWKSLSTFQIDYIICHPF